MGRGRFGYLNVNLCGHINCRPLPVWLELLQHLETQVVSARAWRERTAREPCSGVCTSSSLSLRSSVRRALVRTEMLWTLLSSYFPTAM